jgi:UDP-glucose 4-epimerase
MTVAAATKTVLLTGADEPLGKLVLKRLGASPEIGRIFTAGEGAPARGKKVKHLKVSPGSEKIVEPLRREKVDTVVHLGFQASRGRDESAFERNVIGTMTLLGAAAEVPVRKVILRSSYSVYGPHPTNPNYLDEHRRIRFGGKSQYLRDVAEIEKYAHEFLRHFDDVTLTVLRFAPVVGPTSDAPFMQYLRLDACPVVLGFDPLVQLLHEEDAADAVLAAVREDVRGPVNVAPDGVAPLLKVLRFLGKDAVIIPHLPLDASERLIAILRTLPFDAGFLRFPCGLDNARMKSELKFVPKRTTSEALRALQDA